MGSIAFVVALATIIRFRCSIDQFVLPNLTYEPQNSLLAYVEAHVFKFADRAVLDFQCAISICVKDDGSCQGVTVSLL